MSVTLNTVTTKTGTINNLASLEVNGLVYTISGTAGIFYEPLVKPTYLTSTGT